MSALKLRQKRTRERIALKLSAACAARCGARGHALGGAGSGRVGGGSRAQPEGIKRHRQLTTNLVKVGLLTAVSLKLDGEAGCCLARTLLTVNHCLILFRLRSSHHPRMAARMERGGCHGEEYGGG